MEISGVGKFHFLVELEAQANELITALYTSYQRPQSLPSPVRNPYIYWTQI
jgi:hypothetical protein